MVRTAYIHTYIHTYILGVVAGEAEGSASASRTSALSGRWGGPTVYCLSGRSTHSIGQGQPVWSATAVDYCEAIGAVSCALRQVAALNAVDSAAGCRRPERLCTAAAVPYSAVPVGIRWPNRVYGYRSSHQKRFRIRPCTIFGGKRSGAVGVRTISFRARGKPFPLRSSAFIFGLSAGTGPDGALADPPATPAPFEPAASAKPLPLPLPDTDAVAACSEPTVALALLVGR